MTSKAAHQEPRATDPITATGRLMRQRAAGFTYLGVLFAVALMGALLALAGETWQTAVQREKERELLFVGAEFRDAIGLYYNRTPGNVKKFPPSFEDLLKDPRYLVTQRYLRKIYIDPITGTKEWGVIKAADGGIAGVFSMSEKAPIKIASFREENAGFENAQKYSDWKFVFRPRPVARPRPAPGSSPPQTGPAPSMAPPPGPVRAPK